MWFWEEDKKSKISPNINQSIFVKKKYVYNHNDYEEFDDVIKTTPDQFKHLHMVYFFDIIYRLKDLKQWPM